MRMGVGGIAVLDVSIRDPESSILANALNEDQADHLADKCGEDGCMNIKQFHNTKERYFKYCSKRKWSAVSLA